LPNGKIKILCKGADSIIIQRLKNKADPIIALTSKYLNEYASTGLRTLLLAERYISEAEYLKWEERKCFEQLT